MEDDPPFEPVALYTCGDPDLKFPIAAILGQVAVPPAPEAAIAALQTEIALPGNGWLPKGDWRMVATDGDRIQFGAVVEGQGPGVSMTEVTVQRQDRSWRALTSTQCLPIVALAGLLPARWWLDETKPAPDADATIVHVVLKESACTGGRPPFGRIAPPIVAMTETEALIVIGVQPLVDGGCRVDEPATPWQVTLPAPLGNRTVLDGSVWPPIKPDIHGPRGG